MRTKPTPKEPQRSCDTCNGTIYELSICSEMATECIKNKELMDIYIRRKNEPKQPTPQDNERLFTERDMEKCWNACAEYYSDLQLSYVNKLPKNFKEYKDKLNNESK